jgi:hypothetical protein
LLRGIIFTTLTGDVEEVAVSAAECNSGGSGAVPGTNNDEVSATWDGC